MRIAFDLNPILVHEHSGFYSFGAGLLAAIGTLENPPEMLLLHSSRYRDAAEKLHNKLGDWARLKPTRIKMRWLEQLWKHTDFMNLQNFTGDFDVYHSFHHMMPPTKSKPRILTVHDLRRYKLAELYRKSKLELFELAVKKAEHFITVSEATKQDLCSIFPVPADAVDVIHLATNKTPRRLTDLEKAENKKLLSASLGVTLEDYFVAFSSPDKRKNISAIIRAFRLAEKHLPDNYKLVVIGHNPSSDREFQELVAAKDDNSVVLAGPVDNVADVLCTSRGLVFASLYEGFGIPLLEAFASGTAVITSNCSSMPEVGGEAALYVDPHDIESIAEAMKKIYEDPVEANRLIEKGYKRLDDFSWAKTAAKTVELYERLS